jgi:hypothetical protein
LGGVNRRQSWLERFGGRWRGWLQKQALQLHLLLLMLPFELVELLTQ